MLKKNIEPHPDVAYGKNAILLINLGTPKSTEIKEIRRYLREFLSDNRIIEVNKILWFFILNFIILIFRPAKTAKAYKEIWMKDVDQSPLRYYTIQQKNKLSKKIGNNNLIVDYAMRYGSPSINDKLIYLKGIGCENIIILPLYPQYSSATTGSVCDAVYKSLLKMRWQPSIQIVPHYESHPLYIAAITRSIKKELSKNIWKPDIIIASYHGIPKKYFLSGDPYHCYCHKTTRLVKEGIKSRIPIITTFQSRFGPAEWLTPYTEKKLIELANGKFKKVMLVCPGFSSDCIETIEEIGLRAKEIFLKNGGKKFTLVSCLNDTNDHINLLKSLSQKFL